MQQLQPTLIGKLISLLLAGLFYFMILIIKTKKFGDKTVYFDDEDWVIVKDYVWHIQKDKGNFYVRCNTWVNGERKSPKMHRMVMKMSHNPKPHIDHIDRNGLNNRKSNLRICDNSKNAQNIGATVRNTTGYKGVYLYKAPHKSAGLYTCALKANGSKYHGGYFKTAIEAAKRYNELAIKYHGEFASLNNIEGVVAKKEKLIKNENICTPLKKYKPKSKTGFYGVTTVSDSRNKRYTATVYINKKAKTVGYFNTAKEAAIAYDKKAKQLFGENAVLNFPKEDK